MIHIAHVLYSFDVGGLEGQLASLIDHMDSGKFSHSICLFSERTAALARIRNKDVKVHMIKRNFSNDPTVIFRLAGLLKRIRPDIVRTYNWGGMEGVIAAKLAGIGAIAHSEHGFDIEEIYKRKSRRVLLRRSVLRACDKIVAVSRYLENWLINDVKVPRDKIMLIPNGYDADIFFPGKDMERRRALGIKDDELVIGAVGALKELKNQRCLISAFAGLARGRGDLRLLLVGEGPLRKDLEALAMREGIAEKTIFMGEVSKPASIYKAMDIFALPSLSENAPNALLEAMATGLAIVATDVGDVKYMLDEGRCGIVVKAGDVCGLQNGIKYFLEDPSRIQAKGHAAASRAKEAFDIKKIKGIYEDLFVSLAAIPKTKVG